MERESEMGVTRQPERDRFITRLALAAAAVALVFLAWEIRYALILVFAGIVVAVIISSVADPLARFTGVARPWAVLVSVLVIAALLGLFGYVVWPQVQSQGQELINRLPGSIDEVERRLNSWIPMDLASGDESDLMAGLAQRMARWSMTVVEAVTTLVLVIAAGVFLAVRPTAYREGVVKLIAPARQQALRDGLDITGASLKGWLRAQLLSMMTIGAAVTAATWLLGLPAPFALGLIAGLFEFVPIIGPIAAAVPALLLALTISPTMVIWTGLTYFAIEQVESNIVLPLAQSEVADLPPALLIFAFVAFGTIFGIVGIIVSAPLSMALYTLTNELYVKPINRTG